MTGPAKTHLSSLLLVALAVAMAAASCRGRPSPPPVEEQEVAAGEPDQYSATLALITERGEGREETITRVFRLGDLWREEWTERGASLALIWRPDQGKTFLLDVDNRLYVELNDSARPGEEAVAGPHEGDESSIAPAEVERAFDDAPAPERNETEVLPDQTIDGHPCQVLRARATFTDGHAEVTTVFRARDLSGLALRVESGAADDAAGVRLITERRDVTTEVSPDLFNVPAGFKKVDKLPAR